MADSKERPLTPQEKFELRLAKELSDIQARMIGTHPEQLQYQAEQRQAKERVVKEAKALENPASVERMLSYKDLFTEPTRETLKSAREAKAAELQEQAKAGRPPIKSYAELHPNESKDRTR